MILSNSKIKSLANSCGFEICGVAKVGFLYEETKFLESWIQKKFNGTMDWFSFNNDIRANVTLLLDNAKSVIVCAKYYNPEVDFSNSLKIAKYALAVDYHYVIKNQLNELLSMLGAGVNGVCCVDSVPLLERVWAEKCGVGWVGRNGLITTQNFGSMINLAVLVVDCEVDFYDNPIKNRCGTCSKCEDSCPTGALISGECDSRRCLSYLTIEHKGDYSDAEIDILKNLNPQQSIFGCDICTDICPWSIRAKRINMITHVAESKFVKNLTEWESIGSASYNRQFRATPLSRSRVNKIRFISSLFTSTT